MTDPFAKAAVVSLLGGAAVALGYLVYRMVRYVALHATRDDGQPFGDEGMADLSRFPEDPAGDGHA